MTQTQNGRLDCQILCLNKVLTIQEKGTLGDVLGWIALQSKYKDWLLYLEANSIELKFWSFDEEILETKFPWMKRVGLLDGHKEPRARTLFRGNGTKWAWQASLLHFRVSLLDNKLTPGIKINFKVSYFVSIQTTPYGQSSIASTNFELVHAQIEKHPDLHLYGPIMTNSNPMPYLFLYAKHPQ